MLSTLFWQYILSSYWRIVWFFFSTWFNVRIMLFLYVHFHSLLFFTSKCIPVWPSLCNFLLVEWKSLDKRESNAAFWMERSEGWCCAILHEKKESEQTHNSWADYAYILLSCYVLRSGFASINLSWFGRKKSTRATSTTYATKTKNSEKQPESLHMQDL